MARGRHPASARGQRYQAVWSGTTLAVNPSGVTIDSQGINIGGNLISTTELGYLDGITQYTLLHTPLAGYDTTCAEVAWAGTSVGIKPGFTTNLVSVVATYFIMLFIFINIILYAFILLAILAIFKLNNILKNKNIK